MGRLPVVDPIDLVWAVVADPGDDFNMAFKHKWAVLYNDRPITRHIKRLRLNTISHLSIVLTDPSVWLGVVVVVRNLENLNVHPLTTVDVHMQLSVKTAVGRESNFAVAAITSIAPFPDDFLLVFDCVVSDVRVVAGAVIGWAGELLQVIVADTDGAVCVFLAAGVGL